MNETVTSGLERPMTMPGRWDIPYEYTVGEVATEFFRRLRDDAVIVGSPCAKCSRVFVPPRAYCETCFVETGDVVEVGSSGKLQASTIVEAAFAGMPEPPYVVAYVQLDGASTSVVNFLRGVDLSDVPAAAAKLEIGTRVKVVYSSERAGRITDFHFELES